MHREKITEANNLRKVQRVQEVDIGSQVEEPLPIPDICHFFTGAKFLENKIYTEKTRKLRQNTE